MRKVLVIGSGLGGLECGYILSRAGYQVTIVEQDHRIGGCLQTFLRDGFEFDTGFHYVGGLGPGESLEWLFRYFGLMDLPWRQLDRDCVDEVFLGDGRYPLPSGYDDFVDILSDRFPDEHDELVDYASALKEVGDGLKNVFRKDFSLFERPAYDFLCRTVSNPLLRKVLSGASMRIHYDRDTLPFYVFAQIENSFLQSGWRLSGRGSMIAEHLADDIRERGGSIITDTRAVRILESDGRAIGVETDSRGTIFSDLVISDAHPSATLNLLQGSRAIRKCFRERVSSLRNSHGIFTLNVKLKKDRVRYVNHNLHIHSTYADVWNEDLSKREYFMVSFYEPSQGEFAEAMDVMTPVDRAEFSEWEDFPTMRRGPKYEARKESLAQMCLKAAEKAVPGLADAVDGRWASTPLTYRSYTSSHNGSAFGIMKDCRNPMATFLSPRTTLAGLFLTGQNLGIHGMLGVSLTSLLTCSCILGIEGIRKELNI